MLAMALTRPGAGLVEAIDTPRPVVGPGEVMVQIATCGVCRTDLHLVDGELQPGRFPMIPGHEIVGRVVLIRVVRRRSSHESGGVASGCGSGASRSHREGFGARFSTSPKRSIASVRT
jgi:D-arabinose 1-dehydrogenase-like Zn-dependent alcohol dehydrogenase